MLTLGLGFLGGVVTYRLLRGKNLLTNDSGWISTPSTLGWILLILLTPIWWPLAKLKGLLRRG